MQLHIGLLSSVVPSLSVTPSRAEVFVVELDDQALIDAPADEACALALVVPLGVHPAPSRKTRS